MERENNTMWGYPDMGYDQMQNAYQDMSGEAMYAAYPDMESSMIQGSFPGRGSGAAQEMPVRQGAGMRQPLSGSEPGQGQTAPETGSPVYEKITLKFGKGCVGDTFTGKDGKEYKSILIPNSDPNDQRPWASFVTRANAVHENKFGKGMWMKLNADGYTTIRRDVCVGEQDGKRIWTTEKTKVSNRELKEMVEFYKDKSRDSLKDRLSEKTEAARQTRPERMMEPRAKEAVL